MIDIGVTEGSVSDNSVTVAFHGMASHRHWEANVIAHMKRVSDLYLRKYRDHDIAVPNAIAFSFQGFGQLRVIQHARKQKSTPPRIAMKPQVMRAVREGSAWLYSPANQYFGKLATLAKRLFTTRPHYSELRQRQPR